MMGMSGNQTFWLLVCLIVTSGLVLLFLMLALSDRWTHRKDHKK